MFRKLLATALAVGMCFSIGVSAYAEDVGGGAIQEPSFEVKEEVEIPHPYDPNLNSNFLLASNEVIEVIEGDGYGFPLYVFPVDTVITFRVHDGTLIEYFGAWIEEDGKELLVLFCQGYFKC